jgi:hypothetical protein
MYLEQQAFYRLFEEQEMRWERANLANVFRRDTLAYLVLVTGSVNMFCLC